MGHLCKLCELRELNMGQLARWGNPERFDGMLEPNQAGRWLDDPLSLYRYEGPQSFTEENWTAMFLLYMSPCPSCPTRVRGNKSPNQQEIPGNPAIWQIPNNLN